MGRFFRALAFTLLFALFFSSISFSQAFPVFDLRDRVIVTASVVNDRLADLSAASNANKLCNDHNPCTKDEAVQIPRFDEDGDLLKDADGNPLFLYFCVSTPLSEADADIGIAECSTEPKTAAFRKINSGVCMKSSCQGGVCVVEADPSDKQTMWCAGKEIVRGCPINPDTGAAYTEYVTPSGAHCCSEDRDGPAFGQRNYDYWYCTGGLSFQRSCCDRDLNDGTGCCMDSESNCVETSYAEPRCVPGANPSTPQYEGGLPVVRKCVNAINFNTDNRWDTGRFKIVFADTLHLSCDTSPRDSDGSVSCCHYTSQLQMLVTTNPQTGEKTYKYSCIPKVMPIKNSVPKATAISSVDLRPPSSTSESYGAVALKSYSYCSVGVGDPLCPDGVVSPGEQEGAAFECCKDRMTVARAQKDSEGNPLYPDATGCSNSNQVCGHDNQHCIDRAQVVSGSTGLESWGPAIAAVLLLAFFVVALGFMVASLLGSQEIWAWSKAELSEIWVSALYAVNFVFLIGVLQVLAGVFFPSPMQGSVTWFSECNTLQIPLPGLSTGSLTFTDTFCVADRYLNRLSSDSLGGLGMIMGVSILQGLLANFGNSITLGKVPILVGTVNVFTISMTPFYGLNLIPQVMSNVFATAALAVGSTMAQMVFLQFVQQTMASIFLPLGIMLRTFSITRRLGATLMAVSIGLYVLYPASLCMNAVLFYGLMDNGVIPPFEPDTESTIMNLGGLVDLEYMELIITPFFGPNFEPCYSFDDPQYSEITEAVITATCAMFPGPWCVLIAMAWCFIYVLVRWVIEFIIAIVLMVVFVLTAYITLLTQGPGEVVQSMLKMSVSYLPVLLQAAIPAFLLPIFDFVIIITGIRSLSVALGGETRIFGLMEFV